MHNPTSPAPSVVHKRRNHRGKPGGVAVVACVACLLGASLSAAEVRLTADGRLKSDPLFLDGTGAELLFVVQERPVQLQFQKLKLADLSTAPLNPNQGSSEFEPACSADGQVLAFIQSRGNLSLALVIRDKARNKEADIPPSGGFSGPHAPAVSPDKSRVLFSFPDGGRQTIESVNLDARDRKTLITSEGVNTFPNFSPDGARIVFASTRDDDYELYSAAADGTDIRRLTMSPKQDLRPRYSPDGSKIAFTSNRDGNYEIYVMRADGSGVTRVTDNPERDDYACWHPDGNRLVIVSERRGRHDLFLIDAP